jgi:crotonobetainyl-CoA:carnitine CoA-transferase CaiB-like acyl-CoA transferase
VFSPQEWRGLCQVLGKPEWLEDDRYATFQARITNEDELERCITSCTMRHDAEYLEAALQRLDVPAGIVESTKDLFSDPQIRYREAYRELKHEEIGKIWRASPASKFSVTADVQSAAPLLGEHNEYVLKHLLNLSDETIERLYQEGAITTEKDLFAG